jgi:hypothetical protein
VKCPMYPRGLLTKKKREKKLGIEGVVQPSLKSL